MAEPEPCLVVTCDGPDRFGQVRLLVDGVVVAWQYRPEWSESDGRGGKRGA